MQEKLERIFLKGARPYLWICLLGLIIYGKSIFYGFNFLDDNTLILDNLLFLRNITNLPKAFLLDVFRLANQPSAYYRPVLTISLMFDSFISGDKAFMYRITNIVIHLISSGLVFVFLNKIGINKRLAFLFGLIFIVHPVLSQAVAWIPGRNDSLLTLFFLASFIFYINFCEQNKIRYFFFHLLFFALALFTKETAISLFFLIPLYMVLYRRRDFFKTNYFIIYFSWILIFVIWFVLRKYALVNPIQYSFNEGITSLTSSLPAVFLYLGKVVFPYNLNVFPVLKDSSLISGIISTSLLTALIVFSKNKSNKIVLFGLTWFLVTLIPAFIRPNSNYIPDFLEHRVYLPMIGLMLSLSQVSWLRNFNLSKVRNLASPIIVLSIYSVITFIHIDVFKNRISFWENAVKNSPDHPLVRKNLGAMYYLDGNYDEALTQWDKSLELYPSEPMVHNNLGLIYVSKGEYQKAEDEYLKEISINPQYGNVYFNYGLLLYKIGDFGKMEEMFNKAYQIDPGNFNALIDLAIFYKEQGNTTKFMYYKNMLTKLGVNTDELSN